MSDFTTSCIFSSDRKEHLGVGGGAVRGPLGQNLTAGCLHLFCESFHRAHNAIMTHGIHTKALSHVSDEETPRFLSILLRNLFFHAFFFFLRSGLMSTFTATRLSDSNARQERKLLRRWRRRSTSFDDLAPHMSAGPTNQTVMFRSGLYRG